MKKRPVQGTNGTSSPLVPFPRSHAPAWECIRRYWLTPVWVPTQERGNQKVSHFEVEFANTPSSPRRQESTPSPVIPAKAGIHNSRARGNSSTHTPTPEKILTHSRHSREGGNPTPPSVIPAKAGIHNSRARGNSTKTPSKPTRHLIPVKDYLNVIPAKAGIHNSRACGNSSFLVPTLQRGNAYGAIGWLRYEFSRKSMGTRNKRRSIPTVTSF